MTVFGHSTVVFLAGKQVLPVDYEAEFKTYVTALFLVAHTGSLALVKKLLGFAAVLLSCENVKASNNRVISPGTSPNTDGIHVDLVSIWVGDTMSEFDEKTKNLRCFFPLLSDEMVEGLSVKECNVCELSGVVIAEAFLLRMCLEFREGISRNVLQEELRTWAVGSVTAYKNVNFFETLRKMLLEQTLPVSSLLSSEDEIILRKVLYDVVILPEYSFLRLERITQQPERQSLAVARLMVTHKFPGVCIESLLFDGYLAPLSPEILSEFEKKFPDPRGGIWNDRA